MSVPEATMHEYDFPPSLENQIGMPGEFLSVKTVSEPHSMHKPPHGHLGLGVPRTNQAHYSASFRW